MRFKGKMKILKKDPIGKFLKIMENSIMGGQSEGHFSYSFFFGSKWHKNQFQTLKFFSCIGGESTL